MLFSDLGEITGGSPSISEDRNVTLFSADSRSLSGRPDEVFVAVKSDKRDGHPFIKSAHEKGVLNFIATKDPRIEGVNWLRVKNSLESLHKIAVHRRGQHTYPVIGITGSNGKTTVKEWLSTLLAERFFVIKSPKSFNSQLGVPLSVLAMRTNHEIGVFEAGLSKKGEMAKLAKIIQPDIGIFTTLGEAHDDGFESREQKLIEKLKLFHHCEHLICRGDRPWYSTIEKSLKNVRLISWSVLEGADYFVSWDNGSVTVNDWKFQSHFHFYEQAALENATHCIISSIELGLAKEEIQKGLNMLHPVPMRLELKKGINGCYILDDSYNNDLEGLRMAVDYLDAHRQNQKKTLVLSDILHSSKPDAVLYQEISELMVQKGFQRLIGIGKRIKKAKKYFPPNSVFFSTTSEWLNHLPDFDHEMVLIKGARDFELERAVHALEEKNHGTVLEVNFEALQFNLDQYRDLLSPDTQLMIMVKANAYGGGLLEVANFLQHQRVDQLGVAYVDEAIQLRQNGISMPIMIMNPHVDSFSQFEKYELQPEIFSIPYLRRFIEDTKKPTPIHLKIDTGMHRLGFAIEEISTLKKVLTDHPSLQVASIFTHFSGSDAAEHDEFTKHQAGLFDQAYEELVSTIGYKPTKHACNSPAIVRWPDYHYDMARLGIGLHGFDPTGTMRLKPVSKLRTSISQIQVLKKGESVGYSRKGMMARESRIAVLPIGYEDGFLRVFGNGNTSVSINGSLCPTVGNICMDMTMVDVTDVVANDGDEAVIFGENPTIFDLAKSAKTIPYEILTNVSSRVKRVFVSE